MPARIRVTLGCMEDILHRPHHTSVMDARSLLRLRGFPARGAVTPSLYEAKGDGAG